MFNQEQFDVFRQTEGVSKDVNEVVHLLGRQLEGQEGGHDPGEGGHVVRGVQSYRVVINERHNVLHYCDPILSPGDFLSLLGAYQVWSI